MDTVNYTQFRKELASLLDKVHEDSAPLLVTRSKSAPVVVMSLDDFKSYEATFHLFSSERNAKRLNTAIEELRQGKGQERHY